jgi:hypothetical protein
MVTGALFGIGLAFVARAVPRRLLVAFGTLYGLGVFAVTSFVFLPLAAAVTGSGTTISHMAQTVGWATFAIEHMMFGLALGAALLVVTSRADRSSTTAAGSASRSGRRRRPGTSARSSCRRSLRSPPVCAATDHSP